MCCFAHSLPGNSGYPGLMSDRFVALFSIFLGIGLVTAAALLLAAFLL
jgi:hypothetical protein